MEWRGRRQSKNIEDRRGTSTGRGRSGGSPFGRGGFRMPTGGRRGGGMSLGTIVFLVVIFFLLKFMGVDVLQMLDDGSMSGSGYEQSTGVQPSTPSSDETTAFVRTVLAETEDVWHGIFQSEGATYREPVLVLFAGRTNSACGLASAASGPFYCPPESKVYLDTDFFLQLSRQFGASGDFAQAYVIAHEVGHHVQNLTGVLPRFNQARRSMSEADANQMSVKVELQADCYAGVWAHYTEQKGLLEKGDLEEALNAAHQIGDDALQKSAQGYVVPDSFTHGTSAQRMTWFRRGFESGRVADCDTLSGSI